MLRQSHEMQAAPRSAAPAPLRASQPSTRRLDVALYETPGWWDERSRTYASLRSLNEHRLRVVEEWLGGAWAGRVVVDAGCGGGYLAVPLARAGASVLGLDLSANALGEAAARAGGGFVPVRAELAALPVADGAADVVLLADVLEHVPDAARVVAEAGRVLRPGGAMFVHTINRTLRARLLAVTLAEGLGLVPRGTHDHRQFLTPAELDGMAASAGLACERRAGERALIWRSLRERKVVVRAARSLAVSYAALYRKGPR